MAMIVQSPIDTPKAARSSPLAGPRGNMTTVCSSHPFSNQWRAALERQGWKMLNSYAFWKETPPAESDPKITIYNSTGVLPDVLQGGPK